MKRLLNNINFSLNNDNGNKLNNILSTSEESTYGFKNLYSLAAIPRKIIRMRKEIKNLNEKRKSEIIGTNSNLKNLKSSFVSNELISYSNYIQKTKNAIFSASSITNSISESNGHNQIKSSVINKYKIANKISLEKIELWISKNKRYFIVAGGTFLIGGVVFIVAGSLYLCNEVTTKYNERVAKIKKSRSNYNINSQKTSNTTHKKFENHPSNNKTYILKYTGEHKAEFVEYNEQEHVNDISNMIKKDNFRLMNVEKVGASKFYILITMMKLLI